MQNTHVVIYRKYRPQSLREVVGQDHITKQLNASLKKGEIAHAYLFSGPRGTGKTSVARILARAVNCESNNLPPCLKCKNCLLIEKSPVIDIVEIDAASNRGIDEIRELRDGISYLPQQLKKKVYVIDEVHMLTREAFNALLKTLEEPPPHVLFILATTEPQKVPATILSRVEHFRFHRITVNIIETRLNQIIEKEKIKADRDAVHTISLLAEGSMRDAESMLEQVRGGGSSITSDSVSEMFGAPQAAMIAKCVGALIQKDAEVVLSIVQDHISRGGSVIELNRFIIEDLRHAMILKKYDSYREDLSESMSEERIKFLVQIGLSVSERDFVSILNILLRAFHSTHTGILPQLPFEIAVIQACSRT